MFEGWKRSFLGGGMSMVLATTMLGCGMFGSDSDKNRDSSRVERRDSADRVPDSAKVVAEGRSSDMSFKANDDGRAYLYDATNDRLVNSWVVEKGQRLTVSPDNKAISLDGRAVSSSTELNTKTNYRLLFDAKD